MSCFDFQKRSKKRARRQLEQQPVFVAASVCETARRRKLDTLSVCVPASSSKPNRHQQSPKPITKGRVFDSFFDLMLNQLRLLWEDSAFLRNSCGLPSLHFQMSGFCDSKTTFWHTFAIPWKCFSNFRRVVVSCGPACCRKRVFRRQQRGRRGHLWQIRLKERRVGYRK